VTTWAGVTVGRPCANNNEFVIVLTDGKNNRVPPEPQDEADLLKADNKTIIVVAIGSGVNMTSLNEIASGSGVFQTTFSTLGNIIDSLTTKICTRKIFSFFYNSHGKALESK
jgi:Mg-chelatase subunit ChlD